jgi:hypothetical protein
MLREPALSLVEMGGARARREPAPPASARPHHYVDGRCATCAMAPSWPGASYACTGVKDSKKWGRR